MRQAAPPAPGRGVLTLVLLSVVAGALAALAFEPVGIGWLAPLAMALIWASLQRGSHRSASFLGLCFGATFSAILLWWLVESVGWVAWIALCAAVTAILTAAAVGLRAVGRLPLAPLWGAAVWVSVEALRASWPLGGMPWGQLGFAAVDTPWKSLLPYAGVSGTGFLTALAGFALAELYTRRTAIEITLASVPVLAVGATAVSPYQVSIDGTTVVGAVQGGVPGDGTDLVAHHRQVTRNHLEATVELAARLRAEGGELSLLIWPENATAVDPIRDTTARESIQRAAAAIDAPVLVGGIVDGPDELSAYNRGILWLPDGSRAGTYTKTHLVPFGEYIPWRSVVGTWFARFEQIPRDMLPGRGEGPIDVDGILVANAICFDVAYEDVLADQVRRGASLAVVQTSNATFFGTSQPEQQFEITRARAAELDRTIVVASTNGVSGVVDADGSVRDRALTGITATLVAEVELRSGLTPAVRFQAARSAATFGAASLGLLATGLRWMRQRRRMRPATLSNPRVGVQPSDPHVDADEVEEECRVPQQAEPRGPNSSPAGG